MSGRTRSSRSGATNTRTSDALPTKKRKVDKPAHESGLDVLGRLRSHLEILEKEREDKQDDTGDIKDVKKKLEDSQAKVRSMKDQHDLLQDYLREEQLTSRSMLDELELKVGRLKLKVAESDKHKREAEIAVRLSDSYRCLLELERAKVQSLQADLEANVRLAGPKKKVVDVYDASCNEFVQMAACDVENAELYCMSCGYELCDQAPYFPTPWGGYSIDY